MSLRTIPAVRQVIYATLTTPPITYQIGLTGATNTLTDANVVPRPIWQASVGGKPLTISPYIAFAVTSRPHKVLIGERRLEVKIWVSSTLSDSDVEELYEQGVRARLHGADLESEPQNLIIPPADISRAGSGSLLPFTVRRCREMIAHPCDFSKDDGRWYISAVYELYGL